MINNEISNYMEKLGLPTPPYDSRLYAESYRYGKNNRYSLKKLGVNGALFFDFATGESRVIGQHSGATKQEYHHLLKKELELKLKQQKDAAIKAQSLFKKYRIQGNSQYLTRKQIKSIVFHDNIKFAYETIAVPLYSIESEMSNLQFIGESGNKRFLAKARKKGCFHIIGNKYFQSYKTIILVEGYATGASVYLATNLPVIVCFDAYNFKPVLEAINSKYPGKTYIIAADNDAHKEVNVGKDKAYEAAKVCSAKVLLPAFSSVNHHFKLTDWNDLHVHEGLREVSRQLQSIIKIEVCDE